VIDDFEPSVFEKDWLIDSAICRAPFCGDGNLDEGEECDDGNNFDGDGCSAECTVEPFCGDGVLDEGEQCDDGNTFDGDGCSAECTFEVGGEGCTPGYWRQTHHYDAWAATGYSPATLFVTAFGVDAFPGRTLGDVVSDPGGSALNQLGFHAVAALLNAASPDVDYDRTPAQVVAAFQAAYASGDYETAKDYFEEFNEQECPL
jgi:cysteine-rich repeat protein